MQPDPQSANSLLAHAITQLGGAGFPAAFAGWLQSLAAPDNLILLAFRDSGPPEVLLRQSRAPLVFSRLESEYLPGAYLLDPYHGLHLAGAVPGLYRLRDIAPDAFQRSRYFTDYYRQTTLLDELAFLVAPAPGVTLTLCLGRDATSGRAFAQREVEACESLAPVAIALARRHWSGLAASGGARGEGALRLSQGLEGQGIALTARQAEVALLILQGHSSGSIGLRLGVSPQTVKVFRRQLYQRCGISSQAELFALMLPLLRGG
jgi:DNA-binding CsgD family transcriptional regulator